MDAESIDGFVVEQKLSENSNEYITTRTGLVPHLHKVREAPEPT